MLSNRSQRAPLGALRQYIKRASRETQTEMRAEVGEHCELCHMPLPSEHRHLMDTSDGSLLCSCSACSLLFMKDGAAHGRYRVIPTRYLRLLDFRMSDEQWDELELPVNMVFLLRRSDTSKDSEQLRAFYPGPAGAMESQLHVEQWRTFVSDNPILDSLQSDVEALLINRVRDTRAYYILPIDACYRLTGIIRGTWRGLSGGDQVWSAISEFFKQLERWAMPTEVQREGGQEKQDARPEL